MKWIYYILILVLCLGCASKNEIPIEVPLVSLRSFDTLVSFEDAILSRPTIIKYDGVSNYFVYDTGLGNVLVFDKNGVVINEMGRRGRGPGEFFWINSISFQPDHVIFSDLAQRLIHRYTYNGEFVNSLDAGENRSLSIPPLPPLPSDITSSFDSDYYSKISNQPHVFNTGDYLLPTDRSSGFLYALYDHNGNQSFQLGEVPNGSSFVLDYTEIRRSIANDEIPSLLKSNVFVVNDKSNEEEIYIVYNSIGKLTKYNLTTGEKLWEKSIQLTEETERLTQKYLNAMSGLLKLTDGISFHRKYLGGVSGPNDDLYLSTYNFADKQLWLHKFDGSGELVMRYQFLSEIPLLPVFDIDFDDERFIVLTEESEIRTYSFIETE